MVAVNECGSPAAKKVLGRRPGGSHDFVLEPIEKSIEIRSFITQMVEASALQGSRVRRGIFIEGFDQLDARIAAAGKQNHPDPLIVNRNHVGYGKKAEILSILIQ